MIYLLKSGCHAHYRVSEKAEKVFEAQNGATRTTLLVLNKTGKVLEEVKNFSSSFIEEESFQSKIDCRLAFLEKGNHAFIFMNPGHDDRILGLVCDADEGFEVLNQTPKFIAESQGGGGNKKSMIAIVSEGAIVRRITYKNRTDGESWILKQDGWEKLPVDWDCQDQQEV